MTNENQKKRLEKLIALKEKEGDESSVKFLKSLHNGLLSYGKLTEKQSKAFSRIEHLSTPEGKKEAQNWIAEYGKKFRKEATICAKYYLANPPYFSDLSKDILNKEGFVPTKPQFEALCRNKYTSRILREYYRKPKFARGDLVQVRNNGSVPYHLQPLKNKDMCGRRQQSRSYNYTCRRCESI